MFSKSFCVSVVILVLGLRVNAHAGITPALGVSGKLTRNDVQRPSTAKPCGSTALTDIDTSTPVTAAADGTMSLNITNFNGGTDGSRAIKTLQIDSSGTGKSFKAAPASAITKNGDAKPASTGTQQLTIKMPAGTTCGGGKTKDLCLMSLTTDGGFGNCVVVKQGGAAAGKSDTAATGVAPSAAAASNTTTADGSSCASGKKGDKNGTAKADRRAVGSRAARAYLEAILAETE